MVVERLELRRMPIPLGVLYGQRVYAERLLQNPFLVGLLFVDEVGPDDGARLLLPTEQKLLAAGSQVAVGRVVEKCTNHVSESLDAGALAASARAGAGGFSADLLLAFFQKLDYLSGDVLAGSAFDTLQAR